MCVFVGSPLTPAPKVGQNVVLSIYQNLIHPSTALRTMGNQEDMLMVSIIGDLAGLHRHHGASHVEPLLELEEFCTEFLRRTGTSHVDQVSTRLRSTSLLV